MLEHRLVAKPDRCARCLLAGVARHQREELGKGFARLVQRAEVAERVGEAAPSERIVWRALHGEPRDFRGSL